MAVKIEVNDKGVFIDGEKVSERGDNEFVSISKRRNQVVVNDREITGFWGGCIAFAVVTVTFVGLALMFAAPFLALIGLGWLVAQVGP